MDDLFQKELESIVSNSTTGLIQSIDEKLVEHSKGIKNFNEGNVTEGLIHLEKAAELDNINSCYILGNIYLNGHNLVKKDLTKALFFLEKAGKLGADDAYYILGLLYQKGEIVKQDYKKALEYFSLSESSKAYFGIGYIYFKGLGVNIDYDKSLEYFYKAYLGGNVDALLILSRMYYEGKGTLVDHEKAFHFAYLASENGNPEAMYIRAFMLENGKGLPSNKDQALKFYKLAKENGYNCENDIDRLSKTTDPINYYISKIKDFIKK